MQNSTFKHAIVNFEFTLLFLTKVIITSTINNEHKQIIDNLFKFSKLICFYTDFIFYHIHILVFNLGLIFKENNIRQMKELLVAALAAQIIA